MRHYSAVCRSAVCVIIVLALIQGTGCGKKTPLDLPEKPGQALTAPENVKVDITGTRMILTWTHEPDPKNAVLSPRYFEVSMAVPEDCEGCPFVFMTVGQAAMPRMVFEMPLPEPTMPRYFRVQAVGDNDVRSAYSSTVLVEKK
jgi:predicted small lipoprotein YifL